MKRMTGERLRRMQFPLILLLGSLPVCPVAYTYLEIGVEPLGWLLPGLCLLLAVLGMLLPGRARFAFGILCSGGLMVLCMVVSGHRFHVVALLPPVLCCGLLLWCLSMVGWEWDRELPRSCFWLGVVCHAVGQFFAADWTVRDENAAQTMKLVFMSAFFLFALLSMLSMNRDSIADASVRRRRAAASMRWKNVVLTVSFFVAALLLYFIPEVVAAARKVCLWLVYAILWLINLFLGERSTAQGGSGTGGGGDFSGLPVGDTAPSVLLRVLEWTLQVLVGAVVLAAAAVLAWVLIRQAGHLLRRLWGSINRYASNVAEEYEDVVTDTREEGKRESALSRFRARRRARVDERTLSPGQRIRYRYRRLLEGHPQWSAGSTARENLPPQAASLYERARYSGHHITREDAERFAAEVRRV